MHTQLGTEVNIYLESEKKSQILNLEKLTNTTDITNSRKITKYS